MSTPAHLPVDTLAVHADADTQKLAARMAQDIFAGIFRHTLSAEPVVLGNKVGELE